MTGQAPDPVPENRGGWWSTWAERLDDAAVRLWRAVLRRRLAVGRRDEDFRALMSGWWLVVSCVLGAGVVLTGLDTWAATISASVILALPAGMAVLRGVLDAVGRGPRYTRGGWRAAAGYAIALAGAVAALQPVSG